MFILDLGYLESVPETIAIDLNGSGKAAATSSFFAAAFGTSTYTIADAENIAIAGDRTSYAKSSVRASATSSDGRAVATASSYSSSSN